MADDVATFLTARHDEEAVRATMRAWHTSECDWIPNEYGYSYPCNCGVPERMMRDVDAKRRVVELHAMEMTTDTAAATHHAPAPACAVCRGTEDEWSQEAWPCPTLRALAAVYADHPDYREEWKP